MCAAIEMRVLAHHITRDVEASNPEGDTIISMFNALTCKTEPSRTCG
jgi:hypothetical protein